MSFLITIGQEAGVQVLRLVGWLAKEDIAEFQRVVDSTPAPLCLDLRELQSADRVAVRVLRALQATGVSFVGASPFIRLLVGIKSADPSNDDPEPPARPM